LYVLLYVCVKTEITNRNKKEKEKLLRIRTQRGISCLTFPGRLEQFEIKKHKNEEKTNKRCVNFLFLYPFSLLVGMPTHIVTSIKSLLTH
jgi:hypothetical protein